MCWEFHLINGVILNVLSFKLMDINSDDNDKLFTLGLFCVTEVLACGTGTGVGFVKRQQHIHLTLSFG